MKRVIIAKDTAYADNKAAAGATTAHNPVDLLEGSIGIFGVPNTSTNNKDKLALIIDGGVDAAGEVPDSAFDGDRISVAVGLASGAREATKMYIGSGADIEIGAQAYAAPVAGIWSVGYYDTTGESANLPTAVTGDVVGIKVREEENINIKIGKQWEVRLVAAESDYSAMQKLADKIAWDSGNTLVTAKVSSNATGAAFATSATVTAVNGATSLTTSAAHGVGVGDYVVLDGDLYLAVTGTATTTLVLDRPYRGASATIANGDTLDAGATVPTELGIELTAVTAGADLVVAAYGNLEDADVITQTEPSEGKGTAAIMQAMEEAERGRLGTASRLSGEVPQPGILTAAGGTYDVYTFKWKDPLFSKGDTAHVFDMHNELIVAFPDGGSAGAQAEFEDIMGVLINGADGLGGLDA